MAYNPNILLDSQFKPAPDKLNSLASILAEKQRMRIEDQAASDASRAAGNANVLSGQSQAEGAMTLEANQAIHPQIMSELQGQQPQQQPNLPPWLAQKPQEAPVQPGQLPPYLQRPQAQGQAPQPVQQQPQDPYAERAAIQQEKSAMLQKEQNQGAALALNPTLAALHNQQKQNLTAREAANTEAIGLKQNADWSDLKKTVIDPTMTPPPGGWNPTKGAKAAAFAKALNSIPGSMMDNPKVKEWVTAAKGEAQNQVFNPAGMAGVNNRLVGTYVSKFDHAQEQYEKKVTPLQNLIETKNSPTWGTAAGDVSLINQLSLAEFGGYKPSEAEYKAFGTGFTPAQYAQKWLAMAQTGNVLPQQVRDNMVKEVENVAKRSHDNFKTTMAEQKKRVQAAGVNPDEVIYPGGAYQNMEDYFGKQKAGANPQSQAPVQGAQGPLSKAEAHWYLDQARGDANAAKAAATKDGRTF